MYQWIQVDLYKPKRIFGVMVQGRSQIQQWVTKFKVQYGNSPDHLNYINYSRSNPKAMVGIFINLITLKLQAQFD